MKMKISMNYHKVLFTDLDGTLIMPIKGTDFPIGCWDIQFKFDTLDAIKKYNPDLVVIITNQGGIEMGYVNEKFFKNKLQWVTSCIAEYCNCDCLYEYCSTCDVYNKRRKPNSGMIEKYLNKNEDKNCKYLMIGDRHEDELCADNAHIDFLYVENFINFVNTI